MWVIPWDDFEIIGKFIISQAEKNFGVFPIK